MQGLREIPAESGEPQVGFRHAAPGRERLEDSLRERKNPKRLPLAPAKITAEDTAARRQSEWARYSP